MTAAKEKADLIRIRQDHDAREFPGLAAQSLKSIAISLDRIADELTAARHFRERERRGGR